MKLRYVAEARQGLSHVRNTAIETVVGQADFLCFIDDDETASERWLDEMITTQREANAECVCGAIRYAMPSETPDWVRKGHFFDAPPILNDGSEALSRGSNNIMISCNFLRRTGHRFDPRFNHAGGEDEFFLYTAQEKYELKIAGAARAVVTENVFPNRVNLEWIVRRKFRYGNTLALCERLNHAPFSRLLLRAVKGTGRIALGFIMLPSYFVPHSSMLA